MATEQQHREAQGRVLPGLAVIAGLVALLWVGGSPWRSVQGPPSGSQTGTTVAVNASPSVPPPTAPSVQTGGSPGEVEEPPAVAAPTDVAAAPAPVPAPAPAQPESSEEPTPRSQAGHMGKVPAPVQPESSEESAPRSQAGHMGKVPAPVQPESSEEQVAQEQEAVPPEAATEREAAKTELEPEQPAAEESVSKPEPEPSVQEPVRVTSQGKETRRSFPAQSRRQARSAGQEQQARGIERKEPPILMTWIYEAKTATPLLRKAVPGAPVVRQLKPGEQLRVVGAAGNYFEVRSDEQGALPAYIRPQDVTLVRIE